MTNNKATENPMEQPDERDDQSIVSDYTRLCLLDLETKNLRIGFDHEGKPAVVFRNKHVTDEQGTMWSTHWWDGYLYFSDYIRWTIGSYPETFGRRLADERYTRLTPEIKKAMRQSPALLARQLKARPIDEKVTAFLDGWYFAADAWFHPFTDGPIPTAG